MRQPIEDGVVTIARARETLSIPAIVAEADGSVALRVRPTRQAVACPSCGVLSRRRHSWYMRRELGARLADLGLELS